jgi:hypothetical protein
LRVQIDSIYRERTIMQTANDCVEPIRRKVTWYISVS